MTLRRTLPLFALVAATPALGEGDASWNDDRARLFSEVCLGTAPGFAELEIRAEAAGFDATARGLEFGPDVDVSRIGAEDACACFMTMGAPDQTALVMAIFTTMVEDFPNAFAGEPQGMVNVTPWRRDGQEVTVVLEPVDFEGTAMIVGRAISQGPCQEASES